MSMDYTQQKLWEATMALATGPGPIRERLAAAGIPLTVLYHGPDHEPAFLGYPDLQRRFDDLYKLLTAVPSEEEGAISASARVLDEE